MGIDAVMSVYFLSPFHQNLKLKGLNTQKTAFRLECFHTLCYGERVNPHHSLAASFGLFGLL